MLIDGTGGGRGEDLLGKKPVLVGRRGSPVSESRSEKRRGGNELFQKKRDHAWERKELGNHHTIANWITVR